MKKIILILVLAGAGYWLYAQHGYSQHQALKAPKAAAVTDLDEAMRTAYAEKKILFILYGRKACPNCRSLHSYIEDGDVELDPKKFVFAEVNCDDPAMQKLFRERFQVEGRTLPFVVVADSNGQQFAARSGFGQPEEFTQFIQDALKRAGV